MNTNDIHWSVTVRRDGEDVVTIEDRCLSGRDITAEDEIAIRRSAYSLLGFLGDPIPPERTAPPPFLLP